MYNSVIGCRLLALPGRQGTEAVKGMDTGNETAGDNALFHKKE